MAAPSQSIEPLSMMPLLRLFAAGCGLACAFFVFYTARLLAVTAFLTHTRAGGQGAYLGAVVFPLLAVGFGLGARALWRRSRQTVA